MPKTVIVPLDGSAFAERAVGPARSFSDRTGAPLMLMTSGVNGPVNPEGVLAAAAARAELDGPDLVVISDQGAVSGLEDLVREATEPVVCMSTHGRSGVRKALLGSTASEAVQRVACPFLLVGPGVDPDLAARFDTVVVCTDGSDLANAVLDPVSAWIRQLHLRLWVVQVLDPETLGALAHRQEHLVEEAGPYSMAQALIHPEGRGVNWEVLHGRDPAKRIVEFASQLPASFVAMATHGRTGLAALALGSVTTAVIRAAPCPVLVVRPAELPNGDA